MAETGDRFRVLVNTNQTRPYYDAMPSGHVATFMATFTVLTQNYPDVKWIKPVGYTLMTALAFQMMSSKVHWASDYPIAVLIGYVIGKTTANRRIKKHDSAEPPLLEKNERLMTSIITFQKLGTIPW